MKEIPEELLPVIEWWEKNGKQAIVTVVVAAVVAVGYYGFKSHQESQRKAASSALVSSRTLAQLETASNEFGGSKAGPSIKLRLAKEYYDAGQYESAMNLYKELSGKGDKKDVAALGATFKKLVVVPNYNNAMLELDSGAVDAVALDVGVAKKKMADMPGKFTLLKEIVMTETYGIGFKKGNTQLRDDVQATLKEMVKDGTMAKIAEKYGIEKNALILK